MKHLWQSYHKSTQKETINKNKSKTKIKNNEANIVNSKQSIQLKILMSASVAYAKVSHSVKATGEIGLRRWFSMDSETE